MEVFGGVFGMGLGWCVGVWWDGVGRDESFWGGF